MLIGLTTQDLERYRPIVAEMLKKWDQEAPSRQSRSKYLSESELEAFALAKAQSIANGDAFDEQAALLLYDEVVQNSAAKHTAVVLDGLHNLSRLLPDVCGELLEHFVEKLRSIAGQQTQPRQPEASPPTKAEVPLPAGPVPMIVLQPAPMDAPQGPDIQKARPQLPSQASQDEKHSGSEAENVLVADDEEQAAVAEANSKRKPSQSKRGKRGKRGTKRRTTEPSEVMDPERFAVVARSKAGQLLVVNMESKQLSGTRRPRGGTKWEVPNKNLQAGWDHFKQHQPEASMSCGSGILHRYNSYGTELWVYANGSASAAWQGRLRVRDELMKPRAEKKLDHVKFREGVLAYFYVGYSLY